MSFKLTNDVYSMREVIEDVKQNFIEEEDASRLELGLEAFISATMAKLGTSNIRAMGAICNEMFPAKARLTSNIFSYAYSYNIEDIEATPAQIKVLFCILESDLNKIFASQERDDYIVIDDKCPFTIGEYEYHLDYPIVINKNRLFDESIVYTAQYDMTYHNEMSDITNQYLPSPYLVRRSGETYLYISCIMRQVYYARNIHKVISTNEIYNKTLTFTFEHQFANIKIEVRRGEEYYDLNTIYYGCATPADTKVSYCYYEFTGTNKIKITFDSDSYYPQINDKIIVTIITTDGAKCEFDYTKSSLCSLKNTEDYNYNSIQTVIIPQSKSTGGVDGKTVEQLRKLIPRNIATRGNLTNYDDINKYFNTNINNDTFKFNFTKKADNQAFRMYYGYIMMKDKQNRVVPMNTINFTARLDHLDTADVGVISSVSEEDSNRRISESDVDKHTFIVDTHRIIEYKKDAIKGQFLYNTPEQLGDSYYYSCPFITTINGSTGVVSSFINTIDEVYPTIFSYINTNSSLQFIITSLLFERARASTQYTLTLPISQNIDEDQGIVSLNSDTGRWTTKMYAYLVLYKKGVPVLYFKSALPNGASSVDSTSGFKFYHKITIHTENTINEENNLLVSGGFVPETGESVNYYVSDNMDAKVFVVCKFDDGSKGLGELVDIIPETDIRGYTLTNIYTIDGGLDFFYNMSDSVNLTSNFYKDDEGNMSVELNNVPVIAYNYIESTEKYNEVISSIKSTKSIINNALQILESQFSIDMKFYNTYGKANLYYTDEAHKLDSTALSMNFNLSLKRSNDSYTKQYIIRDIKALIEDFGRENQIDIPSLITSINNTYSNSINYIEYTGFNKYNTSVQHIYYPKESTLSVGQTPEFVNIDIDENGDPKINITLV